MDPTCSYCMFLRRCTSGYVVITGRNVLQNRCEDYDGNQSLECWSDSRLWLPSKNSHKVMDNQWTGLHVFGFYARSFSRCIQNTLIFTLCFFMLMYFEYAQTYSWKSRAIGELNNFSSTGNGELHCGCWVREPEDMSEEAVGLQLMFTPNKASMVPSLSSALSFGLLYALSIHCIFIS